MARRKMDRIQSLESYLNVLVHGLEGQADLLRQSERVNQELEALVEATIAQSQALTSVEPGEHLRLLNEALSAARVGLDLAKSLTVTQQSQLNILREMARLLAEPITRETASWEANVGRAAMRKASETDIDRHPAKPAEENAQSSGTIYVCHREHEHDLLYAENTVNYLESVGISAKTITVNGANTGSTLLPLLDDHPLAVVGYNSLLDQSLLPSGSAFLSEAEEREITVIQWVVDHPSSRWHQFATSTTKNSRYLFNSRFASAYFTQYCLPGATTASMGGVGPNPRSRVSRLSLKTYAARPVKCVVPLSLNRHCGGPTEILARINLLDTRLARVVESAIARAEFDLLGPLEVHLEQSLEEDDLQVPNDVFNRCFNLVEAAVQVRRRMRIFEIARDFPVIIQSDKTAAPFIEGGKAEFAVDVDMQSTIAQMPQCRAVLSVSPLNDMVHDRAMNAINAGCVALVEDNLAHRDLFEHGNTALVFRYDDDSLNEILDLVCGEASKPYDIAAEGFAMRADPRVGFGDFHNLVRLAGR